MTTPDIEQVRVSADAAGVRGSTPTEGTAVVEASKANDTNHPHVSAERLANHLRWLNTRDKAPNDPDRLVLEGPMSSAELAGYDLRRARIRADLTGADLNGALLQGADLHGAILCDAQLGGANLQNVELRGVNLSGAELRGADLRGAVLWDSDLSDADLTMVKGLEPREGNFYIHPLSGANLCGAMMTEVDKAFPALDKCDELSNSAGKAYGVLLGAAAALVFAVYRATDSQLMGAGGDAQFKLPILNIPVTYGLLSALGPAALLVVYVQFHLNLQRLWDNASNLPAVFPDGFLITQKTNPLLLADVSTCKYHIPAGRKRPFAGFRSLVMRIMLYWLVPISLIGFWKRYLFAHELGVSMWHVSIVTLFTLFACLLYRVGRATLARDETILGRRTRQHIAKRKRLLLASVVHAVAVLAVLGGMTTFFVCWRPTAGSRIWTSNSLVGDLARWSSRFLGTGGASLQNAALPNAKMQGLFLPLSNMSNANLPGANLSNTVLTKADLKNANLSDAHLKDADLTGANISGADLSGADLTTTKGLTQAQVDTSFMDARTQLPGRFRRSHRRRQSTEPAISDRAAAPNP